MKKIVAKQELALDPFGSALPEITVEQVHILCMKEMYTARVIKSVQRL